MQNKGAASAIATNLRALPNSPGALRLIWQQFSIDRIEREIARGGVGRVAPALPPQSPPPGLATGAPVRCYWRARSIACNHRPQFMASDPALDSATPPAFALLKIGELEAASGVPVKTIRFYEAQGLLQAARRTRGGFRLFHPDAVQRLAFVKRAQRLGLSLQEIGELLAIRDRGQMPCREVKRKFREKVADLDRRIEELTLLRSQLQALADWAEPEGPPEEGRICPIVESPGADLPRSPASRAIAKAGRDRRG